MLLRYVYIFCLLIRINGVKCECSTWFECTGVLFKNFFDPFGQINDQNVTVSKNNITINGSQFSVFKIEDTGNFDGVFSGFSDLLNKNQYGNKANFTEIYNLDAIVPKPNLTILAKSFDTNLTNLLSHQFNISTEKYIVANVTNVIPIIPISITYTNSVNIKHSDKAEAMTKNNIKGYDKDNEKKTTEKELEKLLVEYEDYIDNSTANSTDYLTIDYVEYYEDTTNEIIIQQNDTEGIAVIPTVTEKQKNKTIHEDDLENFIDGSDNKSYYEIIVQMENKKENQYLATIDDTGVKKLHGINVSLNICNGSEANYIENVEQTIFPWIAAIFVKKSKDADFSYGCDGIILTERSVITARKCWNTNSSTEDILIVVGKLSLHHIGDKEVVYKVQKIILQSENVTGVNNLAILKTENVIEFNGFVKPACIVSIKRDEQLKIENNFAVGYNATSDLTIVNLKESSNSECLKDLGNFTKTERKMHCLELRNDMTTCANLGSPYVIKYIEKNELYLEGILVDKPNFCNVTSKLSFISLSYYMTWIAENSKT